MAFGIRATIFPPFRLRIEYIGIDKGFPTNWWLGSVQN